MARSGIANIDGGSRGNPGPAAWAFTLKDEITGEVIERAEVIGTATNNVAEYTALVELLDFAIAHGFAKLAVKSDSELMVRQMEGKYKVKAPDLQPLHQEASGMTRDFESFSIVHIRRELNARADELCNIALDGQAKIAAKKPASSPAKAPADKDLHMRCLQQIEFYAEDWRNGSPVKPFSELLLKELLAMIADK